MMSRKLRTYFATTLSILIVICMTACNLQVDSPAPTETRSAKVQREEYNGVINNQYDQSQRYSFQEFKEECRDIVSVFSLFGQFGEVETHYFASPEYGEIHYCIYPLSGNEYCFVFFEPQPYTGIGYMILEYMQYPSERFDECGSKIVNPEDIP